ncbi:MAG TPA: M14 family zinc carboxypeptidase [Thermoanaerobaculia bacterium]|nr:M14 family zinc carboxypeptidase [Thermoanaerobaculia bacterium]
MPLILLLLLLLTMQPSTSIATTPADLWQLWPSERFVEISAPCLRHAQLVAELDRLQEAHPQAVAGGVLAAERIGSSVEGRSIHLISVGRGPFEVLLWSQMHGDEPSATPALLDLAHHLLSRSKTPEVARVLEQLTLRMIPMLNPDGAERYERRNAQGIDVNRDALNLSTPEGRLLKEIRDRFEPQLGINLHDQNRRNVVGDTRVLATNAVLAVAGDEEGTVTPGRRRAMRACSAIVSSLAPFTAGGVARYDEDWSPRAFGDNLTAWGTPVVLLESGAPPDSGDLEQLTRLNFVALAVVLRELAADDLAGHDPKVYEDLPRNRSDAWADRLVRGARMLLPGIEPFRADVAWNLLRPERAMACRPPVEARSRVTEVGDARFFGAFEEIAGDGALLLPAFTVGADGWKVRRWLDGPALDRLAGLGVGRLLWRVPPSRLARAEAFARSIAGEGRPSIELVAERDELPSVLVRKETVEGGEPARSLGDILRALAPRVEGALEALSRSRPSQAIRTGAPASFLLVEPAAGAADPLDGASVRAIWIDGVTVAPR